MSIARMKQTVVYFILAISSLFFIMPLYVMGVTSLKDIGEITLDKMWALPYSLDFSSYTIAFSKLGPHLLNSFYLVIPATIISSMLGSMNGYILAKWQFRGSNTLFTIMLFGMFIPYQSILIPLIQFMQMIKLYNTIPGLVLIHVVYGLPITTLIFRNFYASIPLEIMEAAKIDGSSFFGIYRYIMFPLSITSFVVVGIWQFTSVWNEFLFAVTLTSQEQQPIMVALQNLSGSQIVHWNVQMAGALLAAMPTLLVYIFLGRYFIRGLLGGSIKG